MKKGLITLMSLMILCAGILAPSFASDKKDIKVSNKLFSITLPQEVKKAYIAKKENNGLFIYDKKSKKAGYGGFAFGVEAYKDPSKHAMMPGGQKIGELVDKNGTIYDMVLIQPTDVQYDYENGAPDSYGILYRAGDDVNETIQGVKNAQYYNGRGMKGKDLYKEVLNKHIKAIKEKWDSSKLEQENMSYMYNVLSKEKGNIYDKIGYAFYDSNGDGIDELFIGEIAQGQLKGVAYDIYTMVDRKPVHVISGGARNRYYACDNSFICNEYSGGAKESGTLVYIIVENSTELFPQVGFKYDAYENPKNPYFLSYNFDKNVWENVSLTKFNERKAVFEKYERFEYIPFSSLLKK